MIRKSSRIDRHLLHIRNVSERVPGTLPRNRRSGGIPVQKAETLVGIDDDVAPSVVFASLAERLRTRQVRGARRSKHSKRRG